MNSPFLPPFPPTVTHEVDPLYPYVLCEEVGQVLRLPKIPRLGSWDLDSLIRFKAGENYNPVPPLRVFAGNRALPALRFYEAHPPVGFASVLVEAFQVTPESLNLAREINEDFCGDEDDTHVFLVKNLANGVRAAADALFDNVEAALIGAGWDPSHDNYFAAVLVSPTW